MRLRKKSRLVHHPFSCTCCARTWIEGDPVDQKKCAGGKLPNQHWLIRKSVLGSSSSTLIDVDQ